MIREAASQTDQAFLRRLPLFADLPDADLARICRMARRVRVPAGGVVVREGGPGDALYIVVRGELRITKRRGDEELVLAVTGPGEFLGEMALLEQTPRTASVRAIQESELLALEADGFRDLLASSPTATVTILRTLTARLRSTEASLMEREKLASLGTLAAGLAHELNNPAAAIGRSAVHLRDVFERCQHWTADLARLDLTEAQAERLREMRSEVDGCTATTSGAVACSMAEDRLTAWLEARGIAEAWELAPGLVAFDWDAARLESLEAGIGEAAFPVVVRWLATALAARALLDEVSTAAGAISGIVRAVKTYSHLDRAPGQPVDLRRSLEDTLVILRHRLGDGIDVRRDFAPDLPRIEADGGELSQLWTNLIDNAIDAMAGQGTLEVRARYVCGDVVVEITDSGAGIPVEVRSRIFDPFFTTKPAGAGSGLGLHIAHNIVVNRHRGRIEVDSAPGRTRFAVRLPVAS